MRSTWPAFLTVTLASLTAAIPVAPSEALNTIAYSTTGVDDLIVDILDSNNTNSVQIGYINVQRQLDNLGFYLGQINSLTCISTGSGANNVTGRSGFNSTTPSGFNSTIPRWSNMTGQNGAIASLQSVQLGLLSLSEGIVTDDRNASVSAYHTAQKTFESTHGYVFA